MALTLIKTLGVHLNDTFRTANGDLSPVVTNKPSNTFNDDRPNITQSQEAVNTTTEANAQLYFIPHFVKDDVTPFCATNIDTVNNAAS